MGIDPDPIRHKSMPVHTANSSGTLMCFTQIVLKYFADMITKFKRILEAIKEDNMHSERSAAQDYKKGNVQQETRLVLPTTCVSSTRDEKAKED